MSLAGCKCFTEGAPSLRALAKLMCVSKMQPSSEKIWSLQDHSYFDCVLWVASSLGISGEMLWDWNITTFYIQIWPLWGICLTHPQGAEQQGPQRRLQVLHNHCLAGCLRSRCCVHLYGRSIHACSCWNICKGDLEAVALQFLLGWWNITGQVCQSLHESTYLEFCLLLCECPKDKRHSLPSNTVEDFAFWDHPPIKGTLLPEYT